MAENKNYCVNGKCTVCIETEYETICRYFEPCNHECCVKIPDEITYSCHHSASGSFCDSDEANAEYQESQKSSDKYAPIRQLTPDDRSEIYAFALKRSAEMVVEE